ncbi:Cytochrome B5-like protein [Drosera capensis]
MEIMSVTLFIGILLALFIFIPRFHKPSHGSSKMDDYGRRNAASKVSQKYAKAEVSLHNKRTDCWIIIKEKVYDVTSYVEEHPGGDAILVHAGDDSAEGPQHATRTFDMIDDFYIGELDQEDIEVSNFDS